MLSIVIVAAALVQQQAVPSQLIDRGRLDERRTPTEVVQQRPEGTVAVLSIGADQPIEGIEFQGASAPANVAAASENFIGRTATKETLTELAGALAKAYEKANVALYTIAIPDQTFEENIVVVLLAEGWIESVEILSQGGEQFPLLSRQAARMVGEKPLSRSVYERQLSLMRAIPGLTFDASFDNPDDDESLKLQLTPRQDRSELTASISNRGPDLVGDLLVEGRGELYRLLADGDRFTLTASGNPNLRNYRQLGASYAFPIGSDGLTLSGAAIWLETRPPELEVEGRAKLASITALYPVLRTFRSAADVTLGVDGIDSRNAALGNIIVSENTRAARLSGSYVSAGEGHSFSTTGTLSQGLDMFGASVGLTGAEADFRKVNGSASYNRNFGPRLVGRVTMTGQYTADRVPAVEFFSVGGPAIGRAFDTGFLSGDSGVGGLVEAAHLPLGSGDFSRSELYLFGDAASLEFRSRGDLPGQQFTLASAGAGARVRWKDKVELNLEAAKVVDRPFSGYRGDWRLSFYYSVRI